MYYLGSQRGRGVEDAGDVFGDTTMSKSPTQEKLEAQRKRDIRDVVVDSLLRHHGRKNIVVLVCADLDISDATLYRWCEDLDIDINEYRKQEVGA